MEYVLLNKDTPLLQFRIERHEDVVNLTTLVHMDISDLTIIDNATLPINMQPTIKGLKIGYYNVRFQIIVHLLRIY